MPRIADGLSGTVPGSWSPLRTEWSEPDSLWATLWSDVRHHRSIPSGHGSIVFASTELAASSRQQRLPQTLVDLLRRFLLHARHHMAVRVERDADRGVPEPLADDLGVDAGAQE